MVSILHTTFIISCFSVFINKSALQRPKLQRDQKSMFPAERHFNRWCASRRRDRWVPLNRAHRGTELRVATSISAELNSTSCVPSHCRDTAVDCFRSACYRSRVFSVYALFGWNIVPRGEHSVAFESMKSSVHSGGIKWTSRVKIKERNYLNSLNGN